MFQCVLALEYYTLLRYSEPSSIAHCVVLGTAVIQPTRVFLKIAYLKLGSISFHEHQSSVTFRLHQLRCVVR